MSTPIFCLALRPKRGGGRYRVGGGTPFGFLGAVVQVEEGAVVAQVGASKSLSPCCEMVVKQGQSSIEGLFCPDVLLTHIFAQFLL